jgi:hypothetical protein
MSGSRVVDEVESFVRDRSAELTTPAGGECLCCYVVRMLDAFGCDNTLRWARCFRDERAPRATGLERRLGSMGGYCDCEIFMNGLSLVDRLRVLDPLTDELVWPKERPACGGVRRSSTQWCDNWQRQSRY